MKSRSVFILIAAALIAIAAGVWLAGRDAATRNETSALYPQLSTELDKITAVRVFKAGDQRAVELVRAGDVWTVSERAGYPADAAKLRRLVRALADAKLYEEKTSNPESYKSLGVEDVSNADASGARIEIAGPSAPVNLIVGKPGPGGQSQYVRRVNEQQSWLITQSVDAATTPEAWLRKDIIDVSADRVQSATVSAGKQKPYTAAKNSRADAAFTIAEPPKGKSPSSPAAASGFATALASLTLSDVKPAAEFTDAPAAQTILRTFDGLVVQLDGWTREDKRYVAVKTSFDPALATRFAPPANATQEPKSGDTEGAPANNPASGQPANSASPSETTPAAASERDVAADAEKLNASTAGWVYEIPSYRYEQIFPKTAAAGG